jgi:hypothetical protein
MFAVDLAEPENGLNWLPGELVSARFRWFRAPAPERLCGGTNFRV